MRRRGAAISYATLGHTHHFSTVGGQCGVAESDSGGDSRSGNTHMLLIRCTRGECGATMRYTQYATRARYWRSTSAATDQPTTVSTNTTAQCRSG